MTIQTGHKSFRHISDPRHIKELLKPIYTELTFDDEEPLETYTPTGAWFVLVENRKKTGLIHLEQLSNILWRPHIYIYPEHRGKGSEEWGKQVIEFMGPGQKYLAMTPYESAKKYAERLGFNNIGILTNSIKKDGKVMNQYMLELTT